VCVYVNCEVLLNIISFTCKKSKIHVDCSIFVVNMTAVCYKLAFNIMTYSDSHYINIAKII